MFRPSAHIRRSQRPESRSGRVVANESRCRETQPGRVDTTAEPKSQIATMDPPTQSAWTETRRRRLRKEPRLSPSVLLVHRKEQREGEDLGVACNGTYTKQPERDPNKHSARAGSGSGRQRITKTAQPTPRFNPEIRIDAVGGLPLEGHAVAKESRPPDLQWAQLAIEEEPNDPFATQSRTHEKRPGKRKTAPPTNKSDAIHRRHERAGRQRSSSPAPNGDPSTRHRRQPTSCGGNPKLRRPADNPR